MKKLIHSAIIGVIVFGSLFSPWTSASAEHTHISSQMEIHRSRFAATIHPWNIIRTGNRYLGVRYQLGAEYENTRKFDCSSFTQYVFRKNGIRISRGARAQFMDGVPVSRKDLKPGDLVFFSTLSTLKYRGGSINRIGHVGIYAGNNRILHTYGEGGVRYNSIADGWWDKHYIAAVRVIR